MILTLRRKFSIDSATIGELLLDGMFECYTLEDLEREVKVPKETAIPAGEYDVRLTWSNAFGRTLPLICDVPGFTSVRIHPGNVPSDTEGCVLVGQSFNGAALRNSRIAFDKLYDKLRNTAGPLRLRILALNSPKAPPKGVSEGTPEGMRQGFTAEPSCIVPFSHSLEFPGNG